LAGVLLASVSLLAATTATADGARGGEALSVEDGAKPLRLWQPSTPPRRQMLRLQMQFSSGPNKSGPRVTIDFSAEPAGNRWTLKGTQLRMPPPAGKSIPEAELQRLFRCASQISGTLALGDNGIAIQLDLPDDASDDAGQETMRSLAQTMVYSVAEWLPQIGALVPAQPIGVGARWETNTEVHKLLGDAPITVTTNLHHRLAMQDDHVATAVFGGRTGGGPVRVGGRDGVMLHGSLGGEAQLDDRVSLPSRLVVHWTMTASAGTRILTTVNAELTLDASSPPAP
jgi:hypothetical protein